MRAWKEQVGEVYHAFWWERVLVGHGPDGKAIWKRKKRSRTLGETNERKAEDALRDMNELMKARRYGYKFAKVTWATFRDEYKRLTKPSKSEASRERDDRIIGLFEKRIKLYWMENIHPVTLVNYIALRETDGVAHSTINRELNTLKHMTSMAVKWGYLQADPWENVQKFSIDEQEGTGFNEAENNEIRDYCADAYERALHETFVVIGLRPGEAARLLRTDLNFELNDVWVRPNPGLRKNPKKRVRHIYMHPEAKRAFRELLSESDEEYVFGQWGQPQTSRYLARIYKVILKRAAVAGCARKGRHTFGSDLINSGQDIRVVQQLLGHSRVTTTERYTHPHSEAKRTAILSLKGAKRGVKKSLSPTRR